MHYLCKWVCAAALLCECCSYSSAASLTKAIQDITRFRNSVASGCQFTFERTVWVSGTQVRSSPRVVVSCAGGKNLRQSYEGEGGGKPVSAVGFNPAYGFAVSRKPPRPAWNVTDLKLGGGHEAAVVGVRPERKDVTPDQAALTLAPFLNVEGVPVERLLKHSTFQLVSSSTVGDRLRVEFTSDVESLLGDIRVSEGTLWFLPQSHHVLDEYKVKVVRHDGPFNTVIMKLTWREGGDRPIPISERIIHPDEKPGPAEVRREFTNWSYSPPADPAVFTLTHYGLPEPTLDPPPSNRAWYFAAAAAVAIMLIAAGLWLRRRNK